MRVWFNVIALVVALLSPQLGVASGAQPLVVVLDVERQKLVYRYDGRVLDLDRLVEALRQTFKRSGQDPSQQKVVVLVGGRVTLDQLVNLKATLQGFGFVDLRYYHFGRSKERMVDLKFGNQAIPFTTDPGQIK